MHTHATRMLSWNSEGNAAVIAIIVGKSPSPKRSFATHLLMSASASAADVCNHQRLRDSGVLVSADKRGILPKVFGSSTSPGALARKCIVCAAAVALEKRQRACLTAGHSVMWFGLHSAIAHCIPQGRHGHSRCC
jgi:hypothetical protein